MICRLLINPFHSYCKYVFSVEIRSWTSSSSPERNMPTQVLDSPKIGSPLGLSYKMLKPSQYFDHMNESRRLDLSGTTKMTPPLVNAYAHSSLQKDHNPFKHRLAIPSHCSLGNSCWRAEAYKFSSASTPVWDVSAGHKASLTTAWRVGLSQLLARDHESLDRSER